MAVTTQEMTAGMRVAAGMRGDVSRGLVGLGREEASAINATAEHIRLGQGEAALKELAGGEDGKTPAETFTRGGWEPSLEAQVLTGFAADGTRIAANPTEAANFAQARNNMRANVHFIENGYDGMTIATERGIIRDRMHNFLVSNPAFRLALAPAATPFTIPTATVEESLRDEGLQRQLAKVLNDKFDPDKLKERASGDDFFKAKIEHEEQIHKKNELIAQHAAQVTRNAQATADLATFNTAATYTVASIPGGFPDARASALSVLDAHISSVGADANVRNFKANLDEALSLREKLAITPPPANAVDLNNRLTTLNAALASARTNATDGPKCREFETLYTQRFLINQRRSSATSEVTRLAGEIMKADSNIAMKKASMDLVSAKDRSKSGDLGFSVDTALHEAAKVHLAKKAEDFINNYRTKRTELKTDSVTEYKDRIDRYVQERWVNHRPASFLRNERVSINKRQAKADFATFMGRGADVLIEDILAHAGIPVNQRAIMMKDEGFMKDRRAEILGKMLAAYVVTGGKLKKRQIDAISASAYGEDAVALMKGKQAAHETRIRQAIDAGYTKGVAPDAREQFIEGAPSWLITKPTLRVLLSPMHLIRPLAIQLGKFTGSVDVLEPAVVATKP